MLANASAENNAANGRSSETKLATISSSTPAVSQQALQRASKSGGGSR